jgi:hypothetical protein
MRLEMGREGREYAGEFLLDHIAIQFEDALKSMIQSAII